jgi:phosphatidylglycerophosphate synthase
VGSPKFDQDVFAMLREEFAGASKVGTSFLSPLERRMSRHVIPYIPVWLETYHLTLLTVVWCALIVLSGYLAQGDRRWLWGVSVMIAFQYVTDHFDGKVGKYRNTGLVKWGFYMDHLLDYVFLCSVLASYAFMLPERSQLHIFAVLAVFGGFMVNSFLAFAATEKFKISFLRLGPTEFRLALVTINTLVIVYGPKYMAKALPYVAAGGFLFLCALVYRTQREIWRRDLDAKRSAAC